MSIKKLSLSLYFHILIIIIMHSKNKELNSYKSYKILHYLIRQCTINLLLSIYSLSYIFNIIIKIQYY